MELKSILQMYRDITILLIKEIQSEGNIEEVLMRRDKLLDELKGNSFDRTELANLYSELGISQLEKEANEELMELRDNIKAEMIELKKQKDAARGYNNSFKNINFINKQI